MGRRTQLNINIPPELLKALKRTSIKSGKPLSTLVTETLEEAISANTCKKSRGSSLTSIEKRLEHLEKNFFSLKS